MHLLRHFKKDDTKIQTKTKTQEISMERCTGENKKLPEEAAEGFAAALAEDEKHQNHECRNSTDKRQSYG